MGSLKRRSLRGVEEPQSGGGVNQSFIGGQTPFPASSSAEASVPQYNFPTSSSGFVGVTEKATDPNLVTESIGSAAVAVAVATPERETGPVTPLPVSAQNTGEPLRKPLVIHGKSVSAVTDAGVGVKVSPRKRRVLVYATVVTMVAVILFGTLASVAAAHDSGSGISRLVSPLVQVFSARNGNAANVVSQAMTPTPEEIPADNTVENVNDPNAGVPVGSIGGTTESGGSSNATSDFNPDRFAYGYCTYWANVHYHDLTGYGVPWLGNAYEWTWNAPSYGWTVSSTPNPNGPSIIVLQPDVYQSGSLGHVAVVDGPGDYNAATGEVVTSNMNWRGWNVISTETFSVGAGVAFVWHP
jgi:surface antigen